MNSVASYVIRRKNVRVFTRDFLRPRVTERPGVGSLSSASVFVAGVSGVSRSRTSTGRVLSAAAAGAGIVFSAHYLNRLVTRWKRHDKALIAAAFEPELEDAVRMFLAAERLPERDAAQEKYATARRRLLSEWSKRTS